MFLVDTSVWIEVFRRPSRFQLGSVANLDEVVTCLPVIQEVLQGFLEEHAFRIAREAMFALPLLESPVSRGVFEEAVQLYRVARRDPAFRGKRFQATRENPEKRYLVSRGSPESGEWVDRLTPT